MSERPESLRGWLTFPARSPICHAETGLYRVGIINLPKKVHSSMKKALCLWVAVLIPLPANAAEEAVPRLRPPAVPLVACDPYFSIWSPADTLPGAATVHWTGKAQPLTSLVRIDGKTYRLLGAGPQELPALAQTSRRGFAHPDRWLRSKVRAFASNSSLRRRLCPTICRSSLDPSPTSPGKPGRRDRGTHTVSVYFDSSTLPAVNVPDEKVVWSRESIGLVTLRTGSQDQPVLQKRGDDLRIDWGYLYVAAAADRRSPTPSSPQPRGLRAGFAVQGRLDGDGCRLGAHARRAGARARVEF